MKVTVAICTWNRSGLLDRTLSEMHNLRVPEGVGWELLVVNNNCTDDTDDVIAKHRDAIPVRQLDEPRPGKSHAANTAVNEARGDLMVWTDDDVLVPPGWLGEYVRAAREIPGADYFAGGIDPWFECEPPAWILRHIKELSGVYVVADYGSEARPLRPADGVFGANMAFRTRVARAFPLDTQLGRIRGELPGGDDTDLVARVTAAGHTGYWLPESRVRHFVPAERLTEFYVRKWYRGSGHALVRKGGVPECPLLLGAPRWAIKGYVKAMCLSALYRPVRNAAWLRCFIEAARMEGVIREVRSQHRQTADRGPNGTNAGPLTFHDGR